MFTNEKSRVLARDPAPLESTQSTRGDNHEHYSPDGTLSDNGAASPTPGAPLVEWALYYATLGLHVFPCHSIEDGACTCDEPAKCHSPGKHPRTIHGVEDATTLEKQIRWWWGKWPTANIAVHCDRSGLLALDVDMSDEKDGAESLQILLDTLGIELPATVTARTGKGGWHYIFRRPDGPTITNRADWVKGIDTRSLGYVVVAPSAHESGNAYRWESGKAPWQIAPAEMPPELVEWFRNHRKSEPAPVPVTAANTDRLDAYARAAVNGELDELRRAPIGSQNETLNRVAFSIGTLVGAGAVTRSEAESLITDVVLAWPYDSAKGPWTTKNMARTLKSGLDKGALRPRQLPESNGNGKAHGRPPANGTHPDEPEAIEPAGAPDDAPSTWPYEVRNGCIYHLRKTEDSVSRTLVCEFTASIAEEIAAEDGGLSFRIEGTGRNGAFSFEIPARSFADERQLKAALVNAAGARSPVHKGMVAHLGPAIQKLTQKPARTRSYRRTGWAGARFLIPGRTDDATHVALPEKTPYAIAPDADLAKGLEALDALLCAQENKGTTTAAIAMIFCAPAARIAGWRNERYATFIAGRTGSLKTSWAQTAMCLYGPGFTDEQNLVKWGEGGTRNAIMDVATAAQDLPFLIDNYKPGTGDGPAGFVALMHNLLEGGEKLRLNRAAQLRESRPVHAWPLLTGEDVPNSDAAALARVLVVPWEWKRGEENAALAKAQALADHLCAVGAAWLDWLESDAGRTSVATHAKRFFEERQKWAARLRRIRSDMANPLRVASNLATNDLTWTMMADCPALRDTVSPMDGAHHGGLYVIADAMAGYTAEATEATRYIGALRSLLASGRAALCERGSDPRPRPGQPVIGWRDFAGDAYLLPEVTMREVLGLLKESGGLGGLSNQALYNQLEGLGYIARKGANQTTHTITEQGRSVKVLHLRADAIEGGMTEND